MPTEKPRAGAARTARKTKARPKGTKVLFINAPVAIVDGLDAWVEELRGASPLQRNVTRTDLINQLLGDAVLEHHGGKSSTARKRSPRAKAPGK